MPIKPKHNGAMEPEFNFQAPEKAIELELPPPREIARTEGPPTSKQAAYRCAPNRGTMAWAVLTVLYRYRAGLTDEKIMQCLPIPSYDFAHRKRRRELQRAEMVEDTGQFLPTRTGSEAIVWRITQKGIDYYESKGGANA